MLAPGSGAASDAASAVLSYTEQTEQHLDVFSCTSQLPAIIWSSHRFQVLKTKTNKIYLCRMLKKYEE